MLVSIISRPSDEEAHRHGAKAAYVFVQPDARQLEQLGALAEKKIVQPIVSEVLALTQVRQAHELSEGGHVRGKLVLRVPG